MKYIKKTAHGGYVSNGYYEYLASLDLSPAFESLTAIERNMIDSESTMHDAVVESLIIDTDEECQTKLSLLLKGSNEDRYFRICYKDVRSFDFQGGKVLLPLSLLLSELIKEEDAYVHSLLFVGQTTLVVRFSDLDFKEELLIEKEE